jgi:alanine-alpha-ketoisovalerate/valine-pyruvate aminotransferase
MKTNTKTLIKNIGAFSVNRIGELVQTYANSRQVDFYNFGWGDIATEMVRHKTQRIQFPLDIVCKYSQPEGLDILINHVTKLVNRLSKIKINSRNILITNGAMNAISLLSYYFREFHKTKRVLV